ncbi:MAG: hypothetical protein ABI370_01315 [Gammaproteobacteria bacterium]
MNDLTSAGHPGFSAIDYPHQLKARDKYKLEEKVYGVTGWQVTLSENAITMSNQGLLRILFRVEFLLEKNLYNYQHTAVINILKRIANVNPMREIDNEALATKFTTIFFETLESIYAKYYLDKFKAALILSLTDIKTALKDLPLPLLMIIFEYTPLINSDIRSLDLPRLAPRNPVKFSFSSVGGLHYGEYLVIQGHLKNPDEIVKIFNRIVPNSAKAFPETSKIYIANKALMHPMFVGSYKDAVRLYHPSACTAFTFVEHLVSSRRIRSC